MLSYMEVSCNLLANFLAAIFACILAICLFALLLSCQHCNVCLLTFYCLYLYSFLQFGFLFSFSLLEYIVAIWNFLLCFCSGCILSTCFLAFLLLCCQHYCNVLTCFLAWLLSCAYLAFALASVLANILAIYLSALLLSWLQAIFRFVCCLSCFLTYMPSCSFLACFITLICASILTISLVPLFPPYKFIACLFFSQLQYSCNLLLAFLISYLQEVMQFVHVLCCIHSM